MTGLVLNKKDKDGELLWSEVGTDGGGRESLPCEYAVGPVPKQVEYFPQARIV